MSIASVCLRWRAVALSPTMRHLWTYISLSVPRLPIGSSNLRHTIIRSDIICIVDDFDEFYLARSGHERLILSSISPQGTTMTQETFCLYMRPDFPSSSSMALELCSLPSLLNIEKSILAATLKLRWTSWSTSNSVRLKVSAIAGNLARA